MKTDLSDKIAEGSEKATAIACAVKNSKFARFLDRHVPPFLRPLAAIWIFYSLSVIFGMSLLQWNSVFDYHYEDGKVHGAQYALIASVAFLMSIVAWHILLWPVIFGRSYLGMPNKVALCAIDYVWYLAGFLSIFVTLFDISSERIAERAKESERLADATLREGTCSRRSAAP